METKVCSKCGQELDISKFRKYRAVCRNCYNANRNRHPEKKIYDTESLPDEEWKIIPDFPNYEASDLGRIRNINTKQILKQKLNDREGYKTYLIGLHINSQQKFITVHKLVLITFIGYPPDDSYECCHYDGNSLNNKLSNLRWGTKHENELDNIRMQVRTGAKNGRSKLTDEDIVNIRKMSNDGYTRAELSKIYSIHVSQIGRIIRKEVWTHI